MILTLALTSSSLALALPTLGPSCAPQFGAKVSVTGGTPGSLLVDSHDVDRDGDEDIVVAVSRDRTLVWIEQVALTPGGPDPIEFRKPQILVDGLNFRPATFEFRDLDQDGVDDVFIGGLALLTGGEAYAWSRGLAAGGFASPTPLPDARYSSEPQIFDVDGDGDLDVVVAAQLVQGQPEAGWFENLGGSFTSVAPLSGSVISSYHLDAADLDGDGDIDLAGSFSAGPRAWYRNVGGTFVAVPLPGMGGAERQPLAADLDGDGDVELAYAPTAGIEDLLIYDNVGGPAQFQVVYVDPTSNNRHIALDADLDGDLDLVSLRGHSTTTELATLLNDGALDFSQYARLTTQPVPTPFRLRTADLNADGVTDLVMGGGLNRVSYLLGNAAATPTAFEAMPVPVVGSLRRIQAALQADVDNDGDLDLLVARWQRVPFLSRNLGASLLLAPEAVDVNAHQNFLMLDALDVDGDDVVDIVGYRPNSDLFWGRGRGDGSFDDPVRIGTMAPLSTNYVLADVDGDGDLDLALPDLAGNGWVIIEQTAPGVFPVPRALPNPGPMNYTVAVAFEDVTGDGRVDLVQGAVDQGSDLGKSTLTVFRGIGGGIFDPAPVHVSRLAYRARVQRIQFVDLDADGDLDPVWSQLEFSGVFYAKNRGGGQLEQEVRLFTNNNSSEFQIGDLDLDGFPEVLADAGGRQWLANNRGGTSFDEPTSLNLPVGPHASWRLADLDEDGDLDLITAYGNDDDVAYFPGTAVEPIGADVCGPGVPGASGLPAELVALGSADPTVLDLRLRASGLPALATTLFLASLDRDLVPGAGGGLGTLCLGGAIGRFASTVQVANEDGALQLDVDLTVLPQPTGPVPALAGQTWRFQGWFQDSVLGLPTSNFTRAVEIDFQ